MKSVITMDRFGRLVIPGRIRKALQVSPPTRFQAEVVGKKVELTLVASGSRAVVKKKRGLLVVFTGRGKFNAAAAVSAVREERL